jgi:hypothetical protein
LHSIRYDARQAALDETRPHAMVDSSRFRALQDEGPKRTRRGRQFRPVAVEGDKGNLKAEGTERITDPFEPPPDGPRRRQSGGGGELAAEVLAHLAKRLRPTSSGNLLDQEADQLPQAAVGELDPLELRRDAVYLGRTPCSRPAPGTASLERNGEKSGLHEPVQTTAGDVAVHVEVNRGLSGAKRIAPAARVQEDAPELGIAGGCESVERHAKAIRRHGGERTRLRGFRSFASRRRPVMPADE